MLFNKILCNFCFHYLTTNPTCSEAGGTGDLVSQLIYLRKSSCVVPSKKEGKASLEAYLKESLHRNYNIQLLSPGWIRSLL